MTAITLPLLRVKYEKAAADYLASLTWENFMEATAQATQREITLASLALVKARRPEVQVFNELLVQYPKGIRGEEIGQIVPDNMVVLSDKKVKAKGSYDLPVEKVRPFWVMEYLSKTNHRKEYGKSLPKYEQDLKIPYYLIFDPDKQKMDLFKLSKGKYAAVRANKHRRYSIPKLEMEVALLDGWVRYWYQGELLPLPADLQRELDKTRRQLKQERERAEQERERAEQERERAEQEHQARLAAEAELAKLRAELEKLRKTKRNHGH